MKHVSVFFKKQTPLQLFFVIKIFSSQNKLCALPNIMTELSFSFLSKLYLYQKVNYTKTRIITHVPNE